MTTVKLGKIAFTDAGAYNAATHATTTYKKWDFIVSDDSTYLSLVENNIGNSISDTTKWKCIANGKPATTAAQNANKAASQVTSSITDLSDLKTKYEDSENTRVTNEKNRQDAETIREQNESSRKSAEAGMVASENNRNSSEEIRNTAEGTRSTAEETRKTQESARVTAENARVTAEESRVTAEGNRVTAENSRQAAESTRESKTNDAVTAAQTAVQQATEAINNVAAASQQATDAATQAKAASDSATKAISDANTAVTTAQQAISDANSATATVQQTNASMVESEASRVTAENERVSNENARKSEESKRVTAETSRSDGETTRKSNETSRQNAETLRADAESTRVSSETARNNSEITRTDSETLRKNNETARVNAESSRVTAEESRTTAETSRQNAEGERVTSENARKDTEAARVSSESSRNTAESGRVSAENTRSTNESARQTEYAALKTDMETAVASVTNAVTNANNAATSATNAATAANNIANTIQSDLANLTNTKFDNAYVQEGKLYLQANGVDLVGPLEVGSGSGGGGNTTISYNIRLVNNLESKSLSANKGDNAFINFTFVSQEKYATDTDYSNTGERGLCKIYARTSNSSSYVQVIDDFYIQSNVAQNIDVIQFLTSGTNQIMVKVIGETTSQTTPAMVYSIVLTSLSISMSTFQWWQPYSSNITIPFYIGGNIDKTLHITVTGTNYSQTYTQAIGTTVYTDTSYNQIITHPGAAGIYKISAYVDNSDGSVKTKTVSWNIMCIMDGTDSKLMVVNNVASSATNWIENSLFDYAITDGTAANTSATFNVLKGESSIYQSTETSIVANAKHTFTLSLEQDTADSNNFSIVVSAIGDTTSLTSDMTFNVDNSLGYGATPNAVLYINPKTRNNAQSNKGTVVNDMDGGNIGTTFTNMNWSNDGWVKDADNISVLRLMAGSTVTLDYKPFATECNRIGKTIEFDFKVNNVTDYNKDIITIATDQSSSFIGFKIKPAEISMFTQARKDATTQNLPIDTGVRIRASLVIMPDAYGNSGFNLCILYINSKKNRVFTYENNDYFAQNGNIVIGNDYADIDIYGVRIYDSALPFTSVHKNYINWLPSKSLKDLEIADNDVMDSNGSEIDFTNTVDQKKVFVFNQPFPKKSDQTKHVGTLEIYPNGIASKITVTNVEMKGQGTSSMFYYEWNEKLTLGSTSTVTYADGTTGTGKITLFSNVPACAKITAKKNWASSMQDHKAGSVNAYTDLFKSMGLTNEAIDLDSKVRVSVYQEPMIGFYKTVNDEGVTVYTCMGEFTVGPDKGDKYCFGYNTTTFPGLLSIEGSDNAPLPALFRVPWTTSRIAYNADEEAFQYNGTKSFNFDGGNVANISKWIPAYNLVYQCSPRIRPYNGTLDALNADVANYKTTGYDYWIALSGDANQYNLYYYESSEGKFMPSDIGNGTINLKVQLVGYNGLTNDIVAATTDNDALNTLFINARIAKFRNEASSYFDIDDAIFHSNWVLFTAGTDQRAKNTYPYTFGTDTSKWKWRVDDTDTIFPIDNQGQDKKPYYAEIHDLYSNGANIWNGETSNFWNLLELSFPEEIKSGMKKMLSAMQTLGGLNTGTDFDKLYAFYSKYYLGIKEYFPSNVVNLDAKRYENAKLAQIAGTYANDTDPITQSHGDFYSAETAWVKKRIAYIMSKYSFGTFSASSADAISFRTAGDSITYNIVPAITMYPTIANGTSLIRGSRTQAGETCTINVLLSGTGDQQNNILGASYLMSIGDFHDKNISGSMTIVGKMLKEVILGTKTDTGNIKITITSLALSNCISLQNLVLSNISTLAGTLDLTSCTHLKTVYADGTSITQIKLPQGGGLSTIEYPSATQYLTLKNFPVLTEEGVIIDTCKENISDFYISDCPQLNPVDILNNIVAAQSSQSEHTLKRIRAVWGEFTYSTGGSAVLDNLVKLTDGTYSGLDANGNTIENSYPVLDGKLNINANCYEDTVTALMNKFTQLNLNITGAYYLRFADSTVQSICVTNWGDGTGITKAQCAAVSSIGTIFASNTAITSFNEFKYFTGLSDKSVYQFNFQGCTSLKSISLPYGITTIRNDCFSELSALEYIDVPETVTRISSANCFYNCNLKSFSAAGKFTYIGAATFDNNKNLKTCLIPNAIITSIEAGLVRNCSSLELFVIPETVTSIGGAAFYNCSSLKQLIIPLSVASISYDVFVGCVSMQWFKCFPTTPPTLTNSTPFNDTNNCPIYVPDSSVDAYKTATNWVTYASRIKAISTFTE